MRYVFQAEILWLPLLALQTFKFGANGTCTFTSSDFPLGLVVQFIALLGGRVRETTSSRPSWALRLYFKI